EDLLEQLLQSLPETLDETYKQMLLNIPSASAPYARQMLTLLCCSKRPLSVSELVDAVAVELGQTPRYNPKRRLEDVNAIQEVCPGFTELSVDTFTKEPTIRIAHFSVQEYLESGRLQENDDIKAFSIEMTNAHIKAFSIERTNAHAQMAHICLTFLLDPKLAFSVEQYPFIAYAAKCWPHHFRESLTDESVEIRVLQLFQGSPCLLVNWARIWKHTQHSMRNAEVIGEMPCWTPRLPIHLASSLGLYSVLSKLLDQLHPNHIPTGSSTIDPATALFNQPATHMPATNMNLFPDSVLDGAIRQGHLNAVQLLLEHGAHPDSTSLNRALRIRSGDIAKLLIKHGVEDVAADATALYGASRCGIREIMEYLLDMGADPNHTPHGSDSTPLMVAASFGHNDVAKLLLERGARVDSPAKIRAAVLQSAMGTRIGTSHYLFAFLSEEASDRQNATWESLLLESPRVGDLGAIQHLLKEMVTVDPQLETIKIALSAALYTPWAEEIIGTFSEYGDDIVSYIGPYILDEAAALGREDIVRLLIEKTDRFLSGGYFEQLNPLQGS
ncbi:ankyrin repeat domain-containing protein, partial [Candidatus Bathyarchaeota archaeon]|nr:ankyrin repeat domain-containing protein [Candidatus Bathyarchaeota archaeon]